MNNSGNYPILNGDSIHPDESHCAIRIAGEIYSFKVLSEICGQDFFLACREYGRRHPEATSQQRMEGVLLENNVPLTLGG
jgi:hypothetical protein